MVCVSTISITLHPFNAVERSLNNRRCMWGRPCLPSPRTRGDTIQALWHGSFFCFVNSVGSFAETECLSYLFNSSYYFSHHSPPPPPPLHGLIVGNTDSVLFFDIVVNFHNYRTEYSFSEIRWKERVQLKPQIQKIIE